MSMENEFQGGQGEGSDQGGGPDRRRWRGGRRRRRRRGGGGGGGGGGQGGFGGGQGGYGGQGGGFGGGGGQGPNMGGGGMPPDYVPEPEGPTEATTGVLEYTKEGNGWLRQRRNSYLPDSIPGGDVFVPASLIRSHRLLEGSEIHGQAGIPTRGQQRMTLVQVDTVDGLSPADNRERKTFKDLTVIDPEPMFVMAPGDEDISREHTVEVLLELGFSQADAERIAADAAKAKG